jgi:protein-tyrosine phosphatase
LSDHSAAHLLDGARNFRAVRPFRAADGRVLRENSLFRSGQLSGLSAADLGVLHGLGISLVCDLRRLSEQKKYVSRWPDGATHRQLDLPDPEDSNADPDEIFKLIASEPGEGGAVAAMTLLYRRKPGAYVDTLRSLFTAILAGDALPLLVHCHAGKDRTGFIVAMLLTAAGVSREDIFADYATTSEFFPVGPEIPRMIAFAKTAFGHDISPQAARPMTEARPQYLQTAFDEIAQNFGGVDAYLARHVGLSTAETARYRDLLLA